MSNLRVNRIQSLDGATPVEFATGVSGNAEGLRFEPLIVGYNPTPLETNLNVNTSVFTFTFNQPIEFSGVGTIYIREGSPTGTIFEEFECGVSIGCTIAGETLRLNRQTGNFAGSTNYVITLPNVGIANTYGQYYKGSEGYTFRTSVTEFDVQGGDYEFISANPGSPTGYYKYNVFSTPGIATATAPSSAATDLQVLMIGGGGSGGAGLNPSPTSYWRDTTGGGGGGGVVQFTGPTLAMNAGSWDIVVGAGGSCAKVFYPNLGGYSIPWDGRQGKATTISDPGTTHTAYGGGSGAALFPLGPGNDPTYPDLGMPDAFPSPSDYNWGSPGASGGGGGGNVSSAPTWKPGGSGIGGQGQPGARSRNIQYAPNGPSYPGAQPVAVGGGGGGAGGTGQEGQGYPTPAPTQPNYYGRHGRGGNGVPVPAFPNAVLAPRISNPNPDFWTTMGPTNDYYGGGGAGGGQYANPGAPVATNNVGGYGGGGRTAEPWNSGGSPTMPFLPPPGVPQDGAFLTGGGGGGGKAHPNPGNPQSVNPLRGGDGGPGAVMMRYVHPGSY